MLTATLKVDALVAPRRAARDGFAQYPARQMRDAAGLLDGRDERVGEQQPELGVLPADERLGAVDLARRQIELRLKVEPQLVVAQRARKVADDPDLLQRAVVLPEAIDGRRLVARERLAARARRAPAELGGVLAVLGIAGDAARHLQRDVGVRHAHAGAQRVGLELDPLDGFARVAPRQADDELVAAQVPEHFGFAETAAQRCRRELDDLVAGAMAERRDDAVEPVEPQAHDGQRLVALDGVAQQSDDELAVRQPRQAVVMRLMEDAPLAVRDRLLHRVEAAGELAELVGGRGC